jgi:hypothetical protein
MFACALGLSFGLLGIPAASAITWNFNTPDAPALPNTTLGTTQNYTAGGLTITAAGFASSAFATPLALYSKDAGSGERGVGLAADVDHEIVAPAHIVRIALPSGLTNTSFTMNSSTDGEGWQVWGSNLATSGYAFLFGGTDELSHAVSSAFAFLYFIATGSAPNNVLLSTFTGTASVVPIPPALLLFGTALAGLGILGRRRKKQHPAQAV